LIRRLLPVACILPVLLAGTARADDTLWARTFLDGDNSLPSTVRCEGSDVYVAGSATHDTTMRGFVLKYTDIGFLEWQVTIDFDRFDMVMALDVGPDGNLVIGVDAGTGTPVARLCKLGSFGDTLWTRSYSGAAIDKVAVGADNSIYTVGVRGPSGLDSVWVAKHTSAGTLVWSRTYLMAATQLIRGLDVDAQGQPYAAFLLATAGGDREWSPLVKFSTTGETLWARTLAGVSNMLGVAVDPGGNALVLTSGSVRKIRPDGSQAWSAGVSGQLGFDIAVDDQGGSYVGYTDWSQDFKVKKISASGQAEWVMRGWHPGQDLPQSVAVDELRRPVLAGISTESSLMQALTIKFASVPGVAEPEAGRSPGSPSGCLVTVSRGGMLGWRVARPGDHEYRVLDAAGRQVGPARRARLDAGPAALILPPLSAGAWFIEVRGPGGPAARGRFVVLD